MSKLARVIALLRLLGLELLWPLPGRRNIRRVQQIVQRAALSVIHLPSHLRRVQVILPLTLGQATGVVKVARHNAPAILRQAAQLGVGVAYLLPLGRLQTRHGFGACNHPLPLLRGHAVQLRQPVVHTLLHLRIKLPEAGFLLQVTLLLGQRLILVRRHPLLQMRPWTHLSVTSTACILPVLEALTVLSAPILLILLTPALGLIRAAGLLLLLLRTLLLLLRALLILLLLIPILLLRALLGLLLLIASCCRCC